MTEAKSAQPQLPPMDVTNEDIREARRIEGLSDRVSLTTAGALRAQIECRERQLFSALAENESLKDWVKEWHRAVETALTVWGSSPALDAAEAVAEFTRLAVERDKMMEVIREYRSIEKIHGHYCPVSECGDLRCPTCIKADALLSRETKEEKYEI